jgi:hypothetical protein
VVNAFNYTHSRPRTLSVIVSPYSGIQSYQRSVSVKQWGTSQYDLLARVSVFYEDRAAYLGQGAFPYVEHAINEIFALLNLLRDLVLGWNTAGIREQVIQGVSGHINTLFE